MGKAKAHSICNKGQTNLHGAGWQAVNSIWFFGIQAQNPVFYIAEKNCFKYKIK